MEKTLADEIEEMTIEAASRRNAGVNPASVGLSERERIAYDAIERRIAEQNRRGSLSELTAYDMKRVRKTIRKDDGS